METTQCLYCGNLFTPNTTWQRFCTAACRNKWHSKKRYKEITASAIPTEDTVPDIIINNIDNVPTYPQGNYLYLWMRNKKCLYVGATTNITQRLKTHHLINIASFQPTDEIHIVVIDKVVTWKAVLQCENYLIKQLYPTYNKRGAEYA